jgi:excisionase family DNA binding protein
LRNSKAELHVPEQTKSVPDLPLHQKFALTLEECSVYAGIKICALRTAINDGRLAFIRSGSRSRYLIRREVLEKFMRSLEERAA